MTQYSSFLVLYEEVMTILILLKVHIERLTTWSLTEVYWRLVLISRSQKQNVCLSYIDGSPLAVAITKKMNNIAIEVGEVVANILFSVNVQRHYRTIHRTENQKR